MSDIEQEISTRAYCKMMMHAAKHPSSNINGLLLTKKTGERDVKYVDCIPLFHINTGLAPMMEVALAQVENDVNRSGLRIAGIYHAHDNLRDNHVDTFSQKIADKIAENIPGTLLVTIDSKKLSLNMDNPALILHQHDVSSGKWKKRDPASLRLEHEEVSLQCAAALIHKKIYRDIVDFDNHLDDISLVGVGFGQTGVVTLILCVSGLQECGDQYGDRLLSMIQSVSPSSISIHGLNIVFILY